MSPQRDVLRTLNPQQYPKSLRDESVAYIDTLSCEVAAWRAGRSEAENLQVNHDTESGLSK